jgi:hypothetical protein
LSVTVAPKVAYYATFDAQRYAVSEPRVVTFFQKQRWTLADARSLTVEGGPLARHYVGPGCDEGADVTVISPNGQDDAMVQDMTTPSSRLFFVHRGQIMARRPRLAIVDRWTGELAWSLGLTSFQPSPVVAVVEPLACRLESTLAWTEL